MKVDRYNERQEQADHPNSQQVAHNPWSVDTVTGLFRS